MSDDAQGEPMAAITAWIDAVEQHLLDARVAARQRRLLVGDLERDVRAAIADGAPASQFLREDPRDFAVRLAEANGLTVTSGPQTQMTTWALVGTGLAGALAAAAFVWFFVYTGPVAALVLDTFVGPGQELPAVLGLHVASAALVVIGAATAIRLRFRQILSSWRPAIRAGLYMAAAGVVSIPLVIGIGASTRYSTSPAVVLLEVAVAAAFCGLGIAQAGAQTPSSLPLGSVKWKRRPPGKS